MDARADNARFLDDPTVASAWFLATQCHPIVVERAGEKAVLWHPIDFAFLRQRLHELQPGLPLIGGGLTVGLHAMCLAHTLGYRDVALYGFDSGTRDGATHAYAQGAGDLIDVEVDGEVFRATPTMAAQAARFVPLANALTAAGMVLSVCCGGLLAKVVE
jgi:hypothetical protein